jgi:hypothetical protein
MSKRLSSPPIDYEQPWANNLIRDIETEFQYLESAIQNPISGRQYGSFYDTTTQSIASITTAYPITINTTAENNGVAIVSGSRITVGAIGVYNVQFSAQLLSTDTSIHNTKIWLRKNGVDLAQTAGDVNVPNRHGGINGQTIASWNYVLTMSAGSYLEFYWTGTSTNLSIAPIAAGTSPVSPASPSMIVTVCQV